MEKGSLKPFREYRRWVRQGLLLLFEGDPDFWDRFSRERSHLLREPDPVGSRFRWERPFLERPPPGRPVRPEYLRTAYGVSVECVRRYRQAGLLGPAASSAEGLGAQDLKELQWLLFLNQELRVPISCLTLLSSQETLRQKLSRLMESTPPNAPVHQARLDASHSERNIVHFRERAPFPAVREVRERLHEMGNKLHVISGRAQRLRRKLPDNEEAQRNLSIILAESERAATILGEIRTLIAASSQTNPQRENRT